MRELCLTCLRPRSACYCRYIRDVDCKVKFVFLMHPKEAKRQRTGTGRLAALSLPGSEILVGVDFTRNERLCALLGDEQYYPVLLYPDADSRTSGSPDFQAEAQGRRLLVIIIDSTWFCSKKMLRLSQNLHALPRLSFSGAYRSIFTFKREPAEHCVSTIESCYYLIRELQAAGMVDAAVNPEPLMDVFKQMIRFQLQKENERIASGGTGSHAYDFKYTRRRDIPSFAQDSAMPHLAGT